MNQFEKVSKGDGLRSPSVALSSDPRENPAWTLSDQHRLISEFQLSDMVPIHVRVHFETARNLYLYSWFVYRFYPVAEKQVLATLEFALRERLTVWLPEKYGPEIKIPRGLSNLFAKAADEKLIANEGLAQYERIAKQKAQGRFSREVMKEMKTRGLEQMEYDETAVEVLPQDYSYDSLAVLAETLPLIRNIHAHGSSMLHASVLGTFEIVRDLVNQLYGVRGT